MKCVWGGNQLSCSHAFICDPDSRVSSSVLPGGMQVPLSGEQQLVNGRVGFSLL